MNRSAVVLLSRALGVGISTALLSALLLAASTHTAGAAGAEFTALTATMTVPRSGHTATSLLNGQVFLAGGDNLLPGAGTTYDTAELYEPVANTFTGLTATMTSARAFHTAALLPNGQVLLTGGDESISGPATNTAELYTSGPAACVGDCSGDGEVTVNEIITLVNIALGTQHVSECPNGLPAAATDADVTVAVIIQAVNHALTGCPAPAVTPTPTPTVGPFVGVFTGTFAVTTGPSQGQTGQVTIVIGANGAASVVFQSSRPITAGSGVANLVTGAVTLNQLSDQLHGDLTASVQLQASGTGSGIVVSGDTSATITITAKANIATNYVGVYLGVLNITAGPDSSNNLPIDLFVANDVTAAGATSDPAGDDVGFQGTVNFTSAALMLAVNYPPGMTGNLTGTVATGSFDLFNGDTGTYSFSKVAP